MLGFARELWSCFSVFLNETSRSSLLRPLTFDLARCFSLPSLSRTLALALSPSEENRRILEGNDPGPPVVPGGQGIGLGEWVGDWGGPEDGLVPLVCCRKACHKAKRRVGIQCSPPYAGARAPRGGVSRKRRCQPEEA